MTLQTGDIRFALPASTGQVDGAGGPPTSNLLPDGASNAIFPDISEDARTGGLAEVVHMHGVLRNTDTDALLGANIIISEPPDDPGVGLTLIKSPSTFAVRTDLVALLESTSQPGAEFGGYLLENHVASQRSLNIAQRPGVEPPSVNTTLYLVQDEGLSTEKSQFVRVRRVTTTEQTFSELVGGSVVDFQVQVAACEIFSPLDTDFAGSPPSRLYARSTGKTLTRRVNFSDAGTFYSASRLTEATGVDDLDIKVESVYTQIVPNTRTETPLLNQIPGGTRTLTLTDSQGSFEVTSASHTARILIEEANQGYSHVFKLTPPPAPNSVAVSYVALSNWQSLADDGAGGLSGNGAGTVLYTTGDLSITTEALPDYNTFILVSWADTAAFVNNAPTGSVSVTTQPPEFAVSLTPGSVVNGATVGWVSGGVAKSATANAAGALSGDASGNMVSALGTMYIRPAAMPDPGTGFSIVYASKPTNIETVTSISVDGSGFAVIPTAEEAVPGSVRIRWLTERKVSASSGADLTGTNAGSTSAVFAANGGFYGGGVWRATVGSSSYTESTESSSTSQQVVTHEITDDGAGGFGDVALGAANYAGKAYTLRLTSQAASVNSYRSDHEDASAFYNTSLTVSN